MKLLFSLVIASLLLTGCGGNVKKIACTGQDWTGFGYKAGAEGKSVHEFDAHRSDCGAKLEKNALKAYLDGYTRGIVEFCTYENGYAMGNKKLPMSENCPLEVRASFVKGYNVGKLDIDEKIHRLEKAIDGAHPRPVQNAGPVDKQYGN
ncbi:MAG TPA: DUF2799 domain-containing protein [Cellvibrionaceae bacterium]